jgi:spore coat protein H
MTTGIGRTLFLTLLAALLVGCGGGGSGGSSGGGSSDSNSPDDLVFSEVDPASGWIEILNGAAGEVDLTGVTLEVIDGGSWSLPSGTLAGGAYQLLNPTVSLPATGGARLLTAGGRTIAEISWQSNPVAGTSYGIASTGTWHCMTTPTPGAENVDPAALVLINEFCASNDSNYENPDLPGEYEDWIELYNAGDTAVDLGGYTMTDDLAEPDQWAIPAGTVIAAGGFLMIHADKEDDTLGGTHASFKLAGDGEEIALFASDGSVVDALAYQERSDDRSRGREADGAASWVTFRGPTPDETNANGVIDHLDDDAHRERDPDYDTIFDTSVVRRFDIEIAPDQWDLLRDDLDQQYPLAFDERDFSWVECTVSVEGETWEHVGFRYKGNSSIGPYGQGLEKLPFKLDFDEYEDTYPETKNQRFYGAKMLVFNNSFKDATMIRELLCLELMRDLGAHASRASATRIFVNDVYWGLYINVERVDKRFLADRLDDDSGNLYKPSGTGADLTTFVEDSFEKKTNEDDADWSDVENLIDVLADPAGDLGAVFEVESFLPWLAVNSLLCNLDTYAHMLQNYYLYSDPDSGKFVFVGWDHNEAFGAFNPPGFGPDNIHTFNILDPRIGEKPLIQRVLENPTWNQQYLALVQQLLDGPLVSATIDARMDAWHDLIRRYVTGTEGESYPYTLLGNPNDFDANLAITVPPFGPQSVVGLRGFLTNRRTYVESVLP